MRTAQPVHQKGPQHEKQIAADDGDGQPPEGYLERPFGARQAEDEKRADKKKLVGQRVQHDSQSALLPPTPGDPSIQQISQSSNHKGEERRNRGSPQDQEYQNWHQEDTKKRQTVGVTHKPHDV